MPRKNITAYDLLISCPGDVTKYVDVVKECIESFNITIGRLNNAEIVGQHWSTSSFSQSGDRPQEILNKQFVRDCDAAVAIFWTRFGTSTDKYGSGTEEEIEKMHSAGKQVFTYFITESVDLNKVDLEQYKKVQELSSFFKQPHCIEMTNRLFLKQEVAEMANEDKKDFNAMLHDNKDMPKFQIITDQKSIEKYGGSKMYFAPPIDYDKVMKKIPYGKVITVGKIREYFAELSSADFTEPITAGIFVSIVAWASYQRSEDETPYWRTLKANGELNAKYPNGIEAQKEKLEAEGHTIIQKGRKNVRYYVKDYENSLFDLK